MQLEEEGEAPGEEVEVEVVEVEVLVRGGRALRSRIGCFRGVAVVLCGYVSITLPLSLPPPLPLLAIEWRSTLTQPFFLGAFPNLEYPIHAQRADAHVRQSSAGFGARERSSDADECDQFEGWWE